MQMQLCSQEKPGSRALGLMQHGSDRSKRYGSWDHVPGASNSSAAGLLIRALEIGSSRIFLVGFTLFVFLENFFFLFLRRPPTILCTYTHTSIHDRSVSFGEKRAWSSPRLASPPTNYGAVLHTYTHKYCMYGSGEHYRGLSRALMRAILLLLSVVSPPFPHHRAAQPSSTGAPFPLQPAQAAPSLPLSRMHQFYISYTRGEEREGEKKKCFRNGLADPDSPTRGGAPPSSDPASTGHDAGSLSSLG